MGQEFAFPTHSQVMLMLLVDWGPHLEDHCDTQALHLLDGVLGEADSASDGVSAWGHRLMVEELIVQEHWLAGVSEEP